MSAEPVEGESTPDIADLIASAPPLTPAQADLLRGLLPPPPDDGQAAAS